METIRSRFPEVEHVPEGCYLVGGSVRDILLERAALDVDLATTAAGEAASRFAARVGSRPIRLGRDPLTVWRVTAWDRVYDFAEVIGESIEMDLGRRDFTINALAVELGMVPRLIDPFHGREDLQSRRIRIISEKNIEDDPLRILRAVRFAVQLDFEIDPASARILASRAGSLSSAAPERVTYELDLILSSPRVARGVKLITELGLAVLLFGIPPDQRTVSLLDLLDGDLISSYLVLLQHLGERELEARANRWRWSSQTLRDVLALRRAAEAVSSRTAGALEVVLYDAGPATSRRLVPILRSRGMDGEAGRVQRLLEDRGSLFSTEALLSGHEIQEIASVGEGAKVGRLKRLLLEAQIRGEITTREDAVALILSRRI